MGPKKKKVFKKEIWDEEDEDIWKTEEEKPEYSDYDY